MQNYCAVIVCEKVVLIRSYAHTRFSCSQKSEKYTHTITEETAVREDK